ncbi:MAG TPA: hypothetical protein VFI69_04550 [Candidatus Limnocylindrales bacterium]|nr:hypothetical protein [Candidatus Limnocylindrales bacterium]
MRMRGVLIGTALATAAGIALLRIRAWQETWGVDPDEANRRLPGDDVVDAATGGETRGITIDAPPEAVWPWLPQMGYGRAGWYSYDQLDQRGRSADEIVEAWQTLAVGDVVPTHPGGGFEVVAIDPGRSLVLRSDTALLAAQAAAANGAAGLETASTGVKASGVLLSRTPSDYAASWAFVLEPLDGGQTRFIERFRVRFEDVGAGSGAVLPLLGFGVFVMMQKQMVGIRRRAERLARGRRPNVVDGAIPPTAPPEASPPARHGALVASAT